MMAEVEKPVRPTIAAHAAQWWRHMNFNGEQRSTGAKRAALASLRRVRTPFDVCEEPLALEFVRGALEKGLKVNQDRLLITPAVLSHVGQNISQGGEGWI